MMQTPTLSLYLIAQHFLPHLASFSQSPTSTSSPLKPALLVTNSALPHSPVPDLLSLSLVKAAQKNMVQSLQLAFGEKGVHVGLVTVEGVVGVDEEVRNPKNIARRTVEFWEGKEGLEVRI
jgi:NAD(P)-dependent dehydrogenase (short-subunit alcohol dehydrogenase family)